MADGVFGVFGGFIHPKNTAKTPNTPISKRIPRNITQTRDRKLHAITDGRSPYLHINDSDFGIRFILTLQYKWQLADLYSLRISKHWRDSQEFKHETLKLDNGRIMPCRHSILNSVGAGYNGDSHPAETSSYRLLGLASMHCYPANLD